MLHTIKDFHLTQEFKKTVKAIEERYYNHQLCHVAPNTCLVGKKSNPLIKGR